MKNKAQTPSRERDRQVWRLLTKLGSSRELGPRARKLQAELGSKYEWVLDEENRDEAIAFTSAIDPDTSLRNLNALNTDDLGAFLIKGPQDPLDGWDEFCRESTDQALGALNRLKEDDLWPEERWARFLFNAPFLDNEGNLRGKIVVPTIHTLTSAPERILETAVSNICYLLYEISTALGGELEFHFFALWDRVLPHARSQGNVILSEANSFEQATSHPLGQLASALLRYIIRLQPKKNDGIPSLPRKRLERLISNSKVAGDLYGQCIIASHLPYLFFIERDWASEHVLPLFAWHWSHAVDMWTAFLYRPRFSPDLLALLASDFIDTVRRREELPDQSRHALLLLLVDLGIAAPGWVADSTQRRLLNDLKPAELADAARRLVSSLDGEEPADLWREVVGPWFIAVWPKDKSKRSEYETETLVEVALASGAELPNSLRTLKPYLVKTKDSLAPHLLANEKAGVVQRYPQEVLELLDTIVPSEKTPSPSFFDLDTVLQQLVIAQPALEEDFRFHRLTQFTLASA